MNQTAIIALAIFLIPLAMFLLLALFNRRIPRNGDFLATAAIGVSLILALVLFVRAWRGPEFLFANVVFDWLPMGAGITLTGGFMVDRMTAVMLVVVTLVSFLVHLFSTRYMREEVRYGRYFASLLLFTMSMLGLVLANNLLYLYMFWELVGLSSYVLIGHFFEKKSASDAANKAFITTRLGDVGMFIGIMICYFKVGSLQYADLFAAVTNGTLEDSWRTWAGLGIFFGAMGKSAQFPLHVWLPDAMEGPTPVSALIHAATMVAAGVYLTARLLPLFDETALLFIAYTGGFTALFAATIALVQDDIKKVLAYSTVSQLGYMILALGVGGYAAGMFHLTTHAFFKAGLFLGSGAVIYAMHHEQSLSQYGGLAKKMPATAICYLLATLALTGFPGFSGFWSKDAILANALSFSMLNGHWFLPVAGFATVFMTSFYMFRQYFLTFTGKPRNQHRFDHAHEVPWPMLVPLIVLGTLAVVGGGMGGWFGAMNPKHDAQTQVADFAQAGYQSKEVAHLMAHPHEAHHDAAHEEHVAHAEHAAHGMAMGISTVLGLSGILLGALMYLQKRDGRTVFNPAAVYNAFRPIHTLLSRKYYLDEIYMAAFVMSTRALSRFSAAFDKLVIDGIVNFFGLFGMVWGFVVDWLDRLLVDGLMVNGSAQATAFLGDRLALAQTGRVRQYLVLTLAGFAIISGVCALVVYL